MNKIIGNLLIIINSAGSMMGIAVFLDGILLESVKIVSWLPLTDAGKILVGFIFAMISIASASRIENLMKATRQSKEVDERWEKTK